MNEEIQGELTQEAPESQEQAFEGDAAAEVTETEQTAEPTAEEQAAAKEEGFQIETDDKGRQYIIDEDGNRIPPKRFKEIYHGAKEGERTKEKFDLFKRLGPEGYYKAFPEEKPADYVDPNQKAPVQQQKVVDVGGLRLTYPPEIPQDQRAYEGMTLREIYEVDPVYATQLQTDYHRNAEREVEQRTTAEQTRVKESQREILTFGRSISQELFSKDANDLKDNEVEQVDEVIKKTLEFMKTTKRGGGIIADAYHLMTLESTINDTKTKTAKGVVDSLRRQPVGHINGGPGSVAADNFEALTESQLAETVDKMSDEKKADFYSKASLALRKKYPSWPWD